MQITIDEIYREYRGLLISVAYRMTGSMAEAEDIVQDLFVRLAETDLSGIREMRAYLIRSVTHRALNVMNSSRHRREVYPGQWLPEPVADRPEDDPERRAVLSDDMSYALLVLLERLSPDERAAFLLRDVFGMSYREVAQAMDKTEANSRKLVSRANMKLQGERPKRTLDRERSEAWLRMFTRATESGRFGELLAFVRDDAVMVSDGGGKVRAAIHPIVSAARIAAFFEGIAAKGSLAGEWRLIHLGGEPGLALLRDGAIVKVLLPDWDDEGRIRQLFLIVNPDKLKHLGLPDH
ncbi:RNA polymerase sigma factor SigJ [Paenibacillus sp. HJGM_3]|uniref:RNA polymerase sigma factor SigJ n=1 Tax=Paenibacillus sp. HJGM_3 TaxID=3379816 RepID=UPI0038595BC7